MDIGGCLRSGTGGHGMLGIIQNLDMDTESILQPPLNRIDGAVSNAVEMLFHAMIRINNLCKSSKLAVCRLRIRDPALAEMDRLLAL